jgi:hypothetical protein
VRSGPRDPQDKTRDPQDETRVSLRQDSGGQSRQDETRDEGAPRHGMGAQNGTRAHELDPRKEMGAQDSRRGSTSTQGTPQQAAAGGQKPHGLEPQSMALRATDARVEPRKGGVVQRTAEAWEAEIVEEKAACREGVGRGCGQTCGKALQCGHRCGRACHPGEACQQPVLVRAADSCRSDLGGECAGSDGRDDLVRGESRGAVGAVDGQGGGKEEIVAQAALMLGVKTVDGSGQVDPRAHELDPRRGQGPPLAPARGAWRMVPACVEERKVVCGCGHRQVWVPCAPWLTGAMRTTSAVAGKVSVTSATCHADDVSSLECDMSCEYAAVRCLLAAVAKYESDQVACLHACRSLRVWSVCLSLCVRMSLSSVSLCVRASVHLSDTPTGRRPERDAQ